MGTTHKIAHLSDLHLDYGSGRIVNSQGINLRKADGYVAFSNLVTDIIDEGVDAAIVCGDVFHSANPSVNSIIFAQNQFRRFWMAKIPVYILAGNHDQSDIQADIAGSRILHDPYRKIFSHVEPWVKYEIFPGVWLHLVSHHLYQDQAGTMAKIAPVSGQLNIFSTHGSTIDPLTKSQIHVDMSPREILIPDSLLQDHDWSYTLLGHVHERGWVGSRNKKTDTLGKKVYYNGSLIRRGFSDADVPLGRGWTLWEIDSNGAFKATPKQIAQRPQVDFDLIDASKYSASEISEMIVGNLKKTQINGTKFDTASAPILRQKLSSISPAKFSGLDLKSISENSQHALSWQIKRISIETDGEDSSSKTIVEMADQEGADMLKIYDGWAKESAALKDTEDDLKVAVQQQARDFIRLGQEIVLEQD